jgi:mono/diheme cytochrome c family protein
MTRGIIVGIVGTLVVLALGVYAGIKMGLMPANADARPSSMERWAARTSLHATLAREQPTGPVPIPLTDDNLIAGIKTYATNCAVCHGGPAAARTKIARGLYQKPPQLAKDGVEDDPEGETYWKVRHGIRLTGMPAFGETLDDDQLWQVTLFLKHMDSLPPAAERVWKAVKTTD